MMSALIITFFGLVAVVDMSIGWAISFGWMNATAANVASTAYFGTSIAASAVVLLRLTRERHV